MDAPQWLMTDLTIRQCLLEFGDSRVGDLGAGEVDANNLTLFTDLKRGP